MENSFDCEFKFELIDYVCNVLVIDGDPWPRFRVTQTDPSLIDIYGAVQLFTYEHGFLTWKAARERAYDGYLKTSIAAGLLDCIERKM